MSKSHEHYGTCGAAESTEVGTMTDSDFGRLSEEVRHWHTDRRDKMAVEGLKTLLLLNGGGAVALLAFLQAIWKEQYAVGFIPWILWGMIFLLLGGAASGSVHFIRIETSFAYQTKGRDGRKWTRFHNWVTMFAFALFLVGIAVVVIGAFHNIPTLASGCAFNGR